MENDTRILVVDDNKPTLAILQQELHKITDNVHTAQSGEEALLLLQQENIDVLITDLKMPRMSGIELISYAKDFQPDLQCIVLTAYSEKDSALKALKLGTIDYLEKPCKPNELKTAIDRAIRNLALRKKNRENLKGLGSRGDLILNAVGEGVLGLDSKGRILFINETAKRLIGRNSEQLIGKKFHNLAHHTDRYGHQSSTEECPVCSAHLTQTPQQGSDQLFWRQDGSCFPVSFKSVPVEDPADSLGTIITFFDISHPKKVKQILDEKELYLEKLLDNIPCGVLLIDAETHIIVDVNPKAQEMLDAPKERIIGKECHQFVCPAEKGRCPITDLGQIVNVSERKIITAGSRTLPILKTVTPITLQRRTYLLESFVDISKRKEVERDLEATHQVFHSIVDKSLDGLVILDKDGLMQFINDAALTFLGCAREDVLGKIFGYPITTKEITEHEILTPQGKKTIIEMHVAETVWAGEKAFIATLRDITFRKHMEKRLQYLAIHDQITGLPNRNLLFDRLEQMIHLAKREKHSAAVFSIDLNGFKNLNEKMGHDAAHLVLREAAERLINSVRASDTVARIGGGRFILALLNINKPEDIRFMAKRISDTLNEPYQLGKSPYTLGASLGISVFPTDSEKADKLVELAEKTMLRVLKQKKNSFDFYSSLSET